MAVVAGAGNLELVELRQVRVADLAPLLDEETAEWLERLQWDFSPTAELVRRFTGMQTLAGFALTTGGVVAGYTYLVSDERKGLIGDLYLTRGRRTTDNVFHLLGAAVDTLLDKHLVERIESQLLLFDLPGPRPMPRPEWLTVHPRLFMTISAAQGAALPPGPAARKALVENWSPRREAEAAQLIADAYRGHIDSRVNDQYASPAGARRFLYNVVHYPGCGRFFAPASFVALDAWTGRACGVSLASLLSPSSGHITQVCVAPSLRGQGLGFELIRRSLIAFSEAGLRQVSLTVTSANHPAVRLYERMGFSAVRRFAAFVWQRPSLPR